MRIIVNGKETEVTANLPFSYETGVIDGFWRDGDTVTYQGLRHGDSQRAGILRRGIVLEIEEGMRFSSSFTGNA